MGLLILIGLFINLVGTCKMVPSCPKASFVWYLVVPKTATARKDKGSHDNIFHPSGPFEPPCAFSHRVCIVFVSSVIMKTVARNFITS